MKLLLAPNRNVAFAAALTLALIVGVVLRLYLLADAAPVLTAIHRYKDELFQEVTEGLDDATMELVTNVLLKMKSNLTMEGPARVAAVGE